MVQDSKYSEVAQSGLVDAKISDGQAIFEGGIAVSSLTYYDALGTPYTTNFAHVMFLAPEATVILTDVNGNSLGDILEIGLISGSGGVRAKVLVRTSGQVSIQRVTTP